VVRPACTCPKKLNLLAPRKQKIAAANKGTEKKEKPKAERSRGSHGGCKKSVHRGRGGGEQLSLHLPKTIGGDNDNAMVPMVEELSNSASDEVDHTDGLGSRNGAGSKSRCINLFKLK